ncbi:type II and III secretion system protein family protein [Roseiconus nitratireducens]|nr:pilus assembly protein N-terminal domain-containing protein [Roseiconus nitratireducens]
MNEVAVTLALWMSFSVIPIAHGQMPLSKIPPEGQQRTPLLQSVEEAPARSQEQFGTFVKEISSNDAIFRLRAGQGRLLVLQSDLVTPEGQSPLIAAGDPSVIEFEVVGPRHVRITGQRIGVTDLSIVTPDNENISMEVHVTADLEFLAARLNEIFPDAYLELSPLRDHVVVKGEARDTRQVAQIIRTIESFLVSVVAQEAVDVKGRGTTSVDDIPPPTQPRSAPSDGQADAAPRAEVVPGAESLEVKAEIPVPQVINLIRVPGPQQVLLKVQIAELNRTALREFGTSFLFQGNNYAVGTTVGPPLPTGNNMGTGGGIASNAASGILGLLNPLPGQDTITKFAVFDGGDVNLLFNSLRNNQLLKILAEPNLVAMHGQEAQFLSGGEFPVPVPQAGLGGAGVVTIEYRKFGVELDFVPHILDNDRIRLAVSPSVSSLDFATGISIQGTSVPGLNTRNTSTVVELREGQSLAISGILQVETAGGTSRIPGLGDLPYIGPLFSNNSTRTVEKELLVTVTPHLVDAVEPEQLPPPPGAMVCEPNDHEFYLKGWIEGDGDGLYRSTTSWAHPFSSNEHLRAAEDYYMCGPHGYSK